MADYYEILGVPRTASEKDIKTAFRKLAAKHHPDKGGDHKKFTELNEAYQTLTDPKKKQMYDQFGTADPQQAGFNQQGFEFHGSGFEDIFDQMFGGGGNPFFGGSGFGRRRQAVNKTINLNIQITDEESFNGKQLNIEFKLPSGRKRRLDTNIPAGISHGQTIRLTGLGDDSIPNYPAGDLHLTISIRDSKLFNRDGADLTVDKSVSIFDLMLGTEVIITHYNDRKLSLKVPPGTQPGTVFSMKGLGMPLVGQAGAGTLYVKVKGTVPKNLTREQINLVEKLKGLSN